MAEDKFQAAVNRALVQVRANMFAAAEAKNQEIVQAHHPSSVVRTINGVAVAADAAARIFEAASLLQRTSQKTSEIRYRYSYIGQVVDFALQTLRERSPVGSTGDEHPGLYRDSHIVFLNGRSVPNVQDYRPGDIIHVSNDVPYARKIEVGSMKLSVPSGIYEAAALIVNSRFSDSAIVKFVFMPVRVGSNQAWADFTNLQRSDRKLSEKARQEWLVRQPALEIRAR